MINNHPAITALVIGISDYRHLFKPNVDDIRQLSSEEQKAINRHRIPQFNKLSSAATSALRFHKWLTEYCREFAIELTVELMLSPSQGEIQAASRSGQVIPTYTRATLANVTDAARNWQFSASGPPGQILSVFYFVGHGFTDGERTILTLEDFLDPNKPDWQNAFVLEDVLRAMEGDSNNRRPTRQLYFVDSCRKFTHSLQQHGVAGKVMPSTLLDIDSRPVAKADRFAPILFAADKGYATYALDGKLTMFTEALVEHLENDAAEEPTRPSAENPFSMWEVNAFELHQRLRRKFRGKDSLTAGADINSRPKGAVMLPNPVLELKAGEIYPICYVRNPTSHVEITATGRGIDSSSDGNQLEFRQIELISLADHTLISGYIPFSRRIPAGNYTFNLLAGDNNEVTYSEMLRIGTPSFRKAMAVETVKGMVEGEKSEDAYRGN